MVQLGVPAGAGRTTRARSPRHESENSSEEVEGTSSHEADDVGDDEHHAPPAGGLSGEHGRSGNDRHDRGPETEEQAAAHLGRGLFGRLVLAEPADERGEPQAAHRADEADKGADEGEYEDGDARR
ncbi:MAG: hypothetical protein C4343_01445 [Chloroflexota bacterium]